MANRRCFLTLTRHYSSSLLFLNPSPSPSSSPSLCHSLKTLTQNPSILRSSQPQYPLIFSNFSTLTRHFCSGNQSYTSEDEDDDDDDNDDGGDEAIEAGKSADEKESEAAEIGYKVFGPVQKSDRLFKPYEPVFAIVQVGSHQFKVSNGDTISTERLKYCDVNDKLILNKVLMLGSVTQTIIGRPVLPNAAVHAVVEEHALDAKVLIFKKKRRKNYRRTRGHRQELTRLRITDIQGIEKPESPAPRKPGKAPSKKVEKVAVAA